jgi:carbonic anhydrase/acetyltransferase-like protein (isoleucine patch superfamily)
MVRALLNGRRRGRSIGYRSWHSSDHIIVWQLSYNQVCFGVYFTKNHTRNLAMAAIIRAFGGHTPQIADDAFIAESAALIGDVEIGPGSSIWYGAVLRADGNPIRVGARTSIQDNSVVHINAANGPNGGKIGTTLIGSDVTIGHGAIIHACTLEDGCFIGMGAIILDGAIVETGAMVAAGALVSPGKVVKSGELWGGNPARLMRPLTPAQIAGFGAAAAHYYHAGQAYLKGC